MLPLTIQPGLLETATQVFLEQNISSCGTEVDYYDQEGVWKDQGLVAKIQVWDWHDPAAQFAQDTITALIKPILGDFEVDKSHILTSLLPWDIHNDVEIKCEAIDRVPQAVVMIPLEDCSARTIIFDQWSDNFRFNLYKDANPPIPNHVPAAIWNSMLAHCWPKDRFWLSINQVYNWKRGDVVVFDRRNWHASDNFPVNGLDQKRSIILFTSYPTSAKIHT
jgi:hypothetical protein